MMNPNKRLSARNSVSTRMPLKLAGLFAVAFALFSILFFAYDLLTGFAERAALTSLANTQPPVSVDPKIADDLASVLATDANLNYQDVKDPFNDRGGLSGKVAGSTASSLVQASLNTPGLQPRVLGNRVLTGQGTPGIAVSRQTAVPAVETTRQRYDVWVERSGLSGSVILDPQIFSIEDLLPVGIVDGGDGRQEVMFFSETAGKTVSFPLGTMFFDGWLTELRPEGVVFSSNDDRRTVRTRSWARSVKNAG